MATTPIPAPEAQAAISPIGRLIGALFNPKPTFEDIARRPGWVAPLILLTVFGLGIGFVMNQRVDWESYIRQKAEQNPRFAQLPDERKQQALGPQTKAAPIITYVFGGLGSAIYALLLALIYWGAFNLFAGAGVGFGKSFGITIHALMPSAVGAVLAIVVMFLKRPGDVNPEHILSSNVGAFLSSDAPKWLMSLATSLDLFWIWVLALLAVGFAASNPKKVSTGKALGIVFGLWGLWVLVKVGWAVI